MTKRESARSPQDLLTPSELEAEYGIKASTAVTYRARGTIPFVRLGAGRRDRIRYRRRDIEAWLAARDRVTEVVEARKPKGRSRAA